MEEEKNRKYCQGKEGYLIAVGVLLVIIIIGGSLFLVKYNETADTVNVFGPISENTNKPISTLPVQASISFSPMSVSLKKGEKISVNLYLNFQKELRLDGFDVLLVFDPKIVDVSGLVPSKLFSTSFLRKEELARGRVSATFLEENKGGVLVNSKNNVLSFTLTGKSSGTTEMAIVSVEKGATTVITENSTSKRVPFEGKSLRISVD